MLEYRLEPEGGLLVCALGTLEVGGGQIVECSLCLSDILPERRVALAVELLEGEQLRGTRLYTVPPHHEDGPADVRIEGIRFYLPGVWGLKIALASFAFFPYNVLTAQCAESDIKRGSV